MSKHFLLFSSETDFTTVDQSILLSHHTSPIETKIWKDFCTQRYELQACYNRYINKKSTGGCGVTALISFVYWSTAYMFPNVFPSDGVFTWSQRSPQSCWHLNLVIINISLYKLICVWKNRLCSHNRSVSLIYEHTLSTSRKTRKKLSPASFFKSSNVHMPLAINVENSSGYFDTSSKPAGALLKEVGEIYVIYLL